MKSRVEYASKAHAEALRQLSQNDEWKSRYLNYGNTIIRNTAFILAQKDKFNEWPPLFLYSTVSDAIKRGAFSLRYQGQNVAKLLVSDNAVELSTNGFDEKNEKYFNCKISTVKNGGKTTRVGWTSNDAVNFRKFFSRKPTRKPVEIGKKNNEHRIESALLTELTKVKKEEKSLLYIQPVKIATTARFQMPTPLTASGREIKYAHSHGGGIDILARVGRGGGTCLAVIEVKDENDRSEPPNKALEQAIAYATFIHALLRNPEAGPTWWEVFGFTGKLPKQLKIIAACAMPQNDELDGSAFEGRCISLDGNKDGDYLELHSMFFKENVDSIQITGSWLTEAGSR